METAPEETTQVFQGRRAQVLHFIEQSVIEFATHVLDDVPHVAEVGDHSGVRVFRAFYRNLRVVSMPVLTRRLESASTSRDSVCAASK